MRCVPFFYHFIYEPEHKNCSIFEANQFIQTVMKKYLVAFVIVASSLQCVPQEFNRIVFDSTINREVLIDSCNREALEMEEFSKYYQEEYNTYIPDKRKIKKLKKVLSDYSITIVMGSWCYDSKVSVPRFLKVIDEAGYNSECLSIICVDRQKNSGKVDIESLDIIKVPTFILYSKNGMEAGRIIEYPELTYEEDILSIINP